MFKSKKFRIILIIFAAITAVGVITALFGGASSSSSGSKSSHEHDFEVISSVPGTCTNPGSETLRCKTCFYKETRETETNNIHNYSKYQICIDCGFTEHELVFCTDDVPLVEEDWQYNYEVELDNSTCSFILISTSPTSCKLINVDANSSEAFEFSYCNYLTYNDGVLYYYCSDIDAYVKCSIYKFTVSDDMNLVRAPFVNVELFSIKSDDGDIYSGEWLLNPAFIEIALEDTSILGGDYDFNIYEKRVGIEETFHVGTFDISQTTIRIDNFSEGITCINLLEESNAPILTFINRSYSAWVDCYGENLDSFEALEYCPMYILYDIEFKENSEPEYIKTETFTIQGKYIGFREATADLGFENGLEEVITIEIDGRNFVVYKIVDACVFEWGDSI